MNKTLVLVICLIYVVPASSQIFLKKNRRKVDNLPTIDDRRLHYGFYLGINQNDFKVDYRPSSFPNATVEVKPTAGFNVGLIADLRLHRNVNLRFEPGLMSNSKILYFNNNPSLLSDRDSVREIGSTYLHLPLIVKLSSNRWNNIRPYVLAESPMITISRVTKTIKTITVVVNFVWKLQISCMKWASGSIFTCITLSFLHRSVESLQ